MLEIILPLVAPYDIRCYKTGAYSVSVVNEKDILIRGSLATLEDEWKVTGAVVDNAGEVLSVGSLMMTYAQYPKTAMALALGGCAVTGVKSYFCDEDTMVENKHPKRLNKGRDVPPKEKVLPFRKPKNRVFNWKNGLAASAILGGLWSFVKPHF